jgi:hypothetical protein
MIKDICDCCLNHIENHKILNKECECKICIDCAKKEVNHIALNNFEKKYVFKNILIKCKQCNKEIKEVNYCSKIFNMLGGEEKEKLQNEADQRIFNYMKNYCMLCVEKLDVSNEGINKNNYYNYVFDIGNGINAEHCICKCCYNNYNKDDILIDCLICEKKHENKYNKKIGNEKDIPSIDFDGDEKDQEPIKGSRRKKEHDICSDFCIIL